MLNTKTLFIQSLILIAVGITLLTINWIIYIPKFTALQHDLLGWANNATHSSPMPSLEAYGLNSTAIVISSILSGSGFILVFLGSAFLLILLVARLLKLKNKNQAEKPL